MTTKREPIVLSIALIADAAGSSDDKLGSVTELSLPFRGILGIANLETLTALTELRLDNNSIEIIEGLSSLSQLEVLGEWLERFVSDGAVPRFFCLPVPVCCVHRPLVQLYHTCARLGGAYSAARSFSVPKPNHSSLGFDGFRVVRVLVAWTQPDCQHVGNRLTT
jgi:hypothetical protein